MDIESSISRAQEFLLERRDGTGMWHNFLTRSHGEATDWVTAYVGLALHATGTPTDVLEPTVHTMLARQRPDGGFSYNETIEADADSTAFAIRFLRLFGNEPQVGRAQAFLETHQGTDGGFATYLEHRLRTYWRIPETMDVSGWCMSTVDVTSSALLALPGNTFASAYLRAQQRDDGRWRSYWWTDDTYATVYASHALESTSAASKGRAWLAIDAHIPRIPFYTSLSIDALIRSPRDVPKASERVSWLVESQLRDGSWDSSPILRFPHPSNVIPWNDPSSWREPSADQHRVFTTATCLKALATYRDATRRR